MNTNKYDSFFTKFKAFLLEFDLLHSNESTGISMDEIIDFEKRGHLKFDNAIKSYLKNIGGSFRSQLRFKDYFCFSLDTIEKAIVEGKQCEIDQQILNNEHHEIDSRYKIELERSLAGNIMPISYIAHSGCFSFVEQGVENPPIYHIFNSNINDKENFILSDNCTIMLSLRHGIFMNIYYHFRLGGDADLSFSKILQLKWVNALAFLIKHDKEKTLKWRSEFYAKPGNQNSLEEIETFEYDFLEFVIKEKGISEVRKYLKEK